MKKLLVVCGPTAAGKTSVSISVAKKFGGEIISADSRQVYKELDIGTGKDIPKNSKFTKPFFSNIGGYYLINGVRVWGYDLVDPKRSFSVSKYSKIARRAIQDVWKREKLPILVGGTGLYIKSVVEGIPTAQIPRNTSLRKNLSKRSVDEMYDQLATLDPIKAANLNSSDKKNPRRLIRAIEVAVWKIGHKGKINRVDGFAKNLDYMMLGINLRQQELYKRIEKRVGQRIRAGFDKEVKKLIKKKVPKNSQAFDSLGYKQWRDYVEGKVSKEKAIEIWTREEKSYAKRQMTWFKKNKKINWFDVSCKKEVKKLENNVQAWYSSDNRKNEQKRAKKS